MGQGNFDDILTGIGKYGRYQLYLALLAGIGCIPLGIITLANVFLSGIPEYRCGDYFNDIYENSTVLKWGLNYQDNNEVFLGDSNLTDYSRVSPWSPKNSSCKESTCRNPCNTAFYVHGNGSASGEVKCREWIYDNNVYGSTVVTKVCGKTVCKKCFCSPA